MAPPSPRRSSRARPTNSQSQHSSSSSGTSNRADRNSRSHHKPSSTKSTPSASLSSEPLDDLDDTLLGRRRKRGQDDDPDKAIQSEAVEMTGGSDEAQEEEDEAVRCLCGSEDYPGRPPVDGPDADFFAGIEFTEDVTGFFVCCDICKVWQHGACVGIFSAESSPDEYFCEQCRKDLHKVHTASNGQKYSKYVPLHRPSRATSRATSIVKDGARSPRSGTSKGSRPNSASHASNKRRSTMNSRDAAYDDEQLRRAIQASKEDNSHPLHEEMIRRSKRARSDSEENISVIKRQRTNSQSESSPTIEAPDPLSQDESDDEAQDHESKKTRNGRPHRERPERDDKERQRQEAADKRKGRAERRRAEIPSVDDKSRDLLNDTQADSDLSEDLPLAHTKIIIKRSEEPPSIVEPLEDPLPAPGTPPTSNPQAGSSHKKSSKSHAKKPKGKNQYTKDREVERDDSPARSISRDIQKNAEEGIMSSQSKGAASDPKSTYKSRHVAPASKTSMLDMRRRVGAIMDFISRTQVDLAAEGSFGSNSNSSASREESPQKPSPNHVNGNSEKMPDAVTHDSTVEGDDESKDFQELNCIEMMDVLTRDMVKWQNAYS